MQPDLGRKVRQSQDQQKRGHDVRSQFCEFKVGDKVYACNYGQGPVWLPGEVVAVSGSVSYTVALEDGRNVHRHTEQLRSRTCRSSAVVPNDTQVPEEDVEGFDVGGTGNVPTGGTVTDSVGLTPSTHAASSPVGEDPPGAASVQSTDTTEPSGTLNASVESTSTGPRRSSRPRHPPIRYE